MQYNMKVIQISSYFEIFKKAYCIQGAPKLALRTALYKLIPWDSE
jgi:hypothetical protein